MQQYLIELPKEVIPKTMNIVFDDFNKCLKKLKEIDTVIFVFTKCDKISPSGAVAIMSFRESLKEKGIITLARLVSNSPLHRMLSKFGLMNINQNFEDALEKSMSQNLIKIKPCMSTTDCEAIVKTIMMHIVNKTHCLKGTRDALHYMINEIWDNAGTHGYKCYDKLFYPKPIYICAYSYGNFIEVAILDRGQGIQESLKQNKKYAHISAKVAIEICIKKGVSGHPQKSPGFGLYSATEFTKENKGQLNIWSSGKLLSYIDEKVEVSKGNLKTGTLVTFRINSLIDTPFADIITNYDSYDEYEEIFFNEILGN